MRTSIRTFVGAALALVALSACKKDFLEQDPSQLFTADQLKKASQWNDGINEGYINGILSTFFKTGNPPAVTMTSHRRPSISALTLCLAIWSCKGAGLWMVPRGSTPTLV